MRVWLAEKSSVARDLAKVLGNPRSIPGIRHGMDTDNGRVLYAAGHLVSIAAPEAYDPKYAEWKVEDLPLFPAPFRLQVLEEKEEWFRCIEKGLVGATEVVIATDAGREGEYIAWLILEKIGFKGRRLRMWSSGANEASLRKAIQTLLPYSEKEYLAVAAQVRAESDWVEGINLTRIFSKKFMPKGHQHPISAGRVQTAALSLIVTRAREIENFKPSQYYELEAQVVIEGRHQLKMTYAPPESARILTREDADKMAERARGQSGPVVVKRQEMKQKPPSLFESSALQIKANALWGWSGERTETVAQALYEKHKLISYPRTSGIHLEDNQVNEVGQTLANIRGLLIEEPVSSRDGKNQQFFIDPSRHVPENAIVRKDVFSSKLLQQSGADHHGIIPTIEKANLAELSEDEKKLYLLIVRQFLAQFHADHVYEQTSISWTAGGITFSASGRRSVSPGWTVLFGNPNEAEDDKEEEQDGKQPLPEILNGSAAQALKVYPAQKVTRAPKWFTEGTIVAAMKNLATVVKDPQAQEILKHAGTIGTQSTWGATIKKLKEREYVFVKKGQLVPSTLGRSLVAFCEENVPQLVNPVTTAQLEMMLHQIEQKLMDPTAAKRVLQSRNLEAIRKCIALPDRPLESMEVSKGKSQAPAAARKPMPFRPPDGGFVELEVPFDQKDECKQMGGCYNGETKKWCMPLAIADMEILKAKGWIKEEKST